MPRQRENPSPRIKVPSRAAARVAQKRQGRSRLNPSTTPEITGRARGGGNGRPAFPSTQHAPIGSCQFPRSKRTLPPPRLLAGAAIRGALRQGSASAQPAGNLFSPKALAPTGGSREILRKSLRRE